MGRQARVEPEQCSSAEGVAPYFSCEHTRPYWTVMVEQYSWQEFFLGGRCIQGCAFDPESYVLLLSVLPLNFLH